MNSSSQKNHFRAESRNVQRVKSKKKKKNYVKRKSSYSIVQYKKNLLLVKSKIVYDKV